MACLFDTMARRNVEADYARGWDVISSFATLIRSAGPCHRSSYWTFHARIRGRDTKPELMLRSILHGLGYRFTVNGPKNKSLPVIWECALPGGSDHPWLLARFPAAPTGATTLCRFFLSLEKCWEERGMGSRGKFAREFPGGSPPDFH